MELVTPRFDNLQNELRRELDPQGVLEEEVFQSLMEAAANRRRAHYADRYQHDRAFFGALRELREIQAWRAHSSGPVPPPQPAMAARGKVIMFPAAAVSGPLRLAA